jgi:thiol-disulfide isomerase/thioredoxin
MITQLSRKSVLNITVALVSLLALTRDATSQTNAATPDSSKALGKPPFCVIQVETADGKALPNAPVVCVSPSTNANLKGTTIEGGSERFQTDVEGRLPLPWNDTNVVVMVANEKGFTLAQSSDLVKSPKMIVHPWGKLEGRRINCGQPVIGQRLRYRLAMSFLVGKKLQGVGIASQPVETDSEGRFAFEFVPPVDILISGIHKHPEKLYSPLQLAEIKPGQTTSIEIATQGRTVVGRLELDRAITNRIDFESLDVGLQTAMATLKTMSLPSIPEGFDTPERRAQWQRDWYKTDAGRHRLEAMTRIYGVEVHSDGSFIGDLIEPDKYWMEGEIEQNRHEVALLRDLVEVPHPGTNAENAPVDIGKATFRARLKVGDVAPDFSVKTLDGAPLKLSALRGKLVLLDFWATWCAPCVAETPNLKEAYDAFGKDERFLMISLSLDSDQTAPAKFARNRGIAWTQGFLVDAFNSVTMHDYHFDSIPEILLIGPDGKILATDLRGSKIKNAVAAALAH